MQEELEAGLIALTCVGPEVGKYVFTIYVTPSLIHGLKTHILWKKDVEDLEDCFRQTLRYTQHCPESTVVPAIYLCLGISSIEAQIHKCMCILSLVGTATRSGSVEQSVIG